MARSWLLYCTIEKLLSCCLSLQITVWAFDNKIKKLFSKCSHHHKMPRSQFNLEMITTISESAFIFASTKHCNSEETLILYQQSVKALHLFSTLILSWTKITISLSPGVSQTMGNWSHARAVGSGTLSSKKLITATCLRRDIVLAEGLRYN